MTDPTLTERITEAIRDDVRLLVLATGTTLKQYEDTAPGIIDALARRAAAAAQAPASAAGDDEQRARIRLALNDYGGLTQTEGRYLLDQLERAEAALARLHDPRALERTIRAAIGYQPITISLDLPDPIPAGTRRPTHTFRTIEDADGLVQRITAALTTL